MKNRSKITLLLIAIFVAIGLSACAASGIGAAVPTTAGTGVEKLTQAQAEAIALNHAGLTADQVTELHAQKDWDNGRLEYEIEFRHADYEFDYTIHAETGVVLDWDKEYDPKSTDAPTNPTDNSDAPTNSTENTVGPMLRSEAEAIALAHAGFTADQVADLRAELDDDWEYEIEFRQGEYEYDYTIDAVTGQILGWDKERDSKPAAPTEPSASVDAPTTGKLTEAEAKAIALAHAGLTEVTALEIEYDVDDGIPTYELEFESGQWEYGYEIHAETGEILDWEKEHR